MKKLLFILMLFTLNSSFAQVKPVKKNNSKNIKKKTTVAIRSTTIPNKTKPFSPKDTITVPESNVNPYKMQLPKTAGPSTIKLNNSVIKTPVYNNNATGTSIPGDVNTGLRPGNTMNQPPENNSLNQIRAQADSARQPH
ncbi:MAG: hypothetical protein QM737_22815 [Ferruginibacter sp.]